MGMVLEYSLNLLKDKFNGFDEKHLNANRDLLCRLSNLKINSTSLLDKYGAYVIQKENVLYRNITRVLRKTQHKVVHIYWI